MINHTFKKSFGQNFFKSDKWPKKIVSIAGLTPESSVLEIGPGQGALTQLILGQAKKVTCIEIDRELITFLTDRFGANPQFELINQDILATNLNNIVGNEPYQVIGALPYNISKKIIRLFLETELPPQAMTLVIQKEVAEDYVSNPPQASFLGIYAQALSDIAYKGSIPTSAFFPEPKVEGAILNFTNIKPKYDSWKDLLKFIHTGFSSPRKKVSSNLGNAGFDKALIEKQLVESGLTITARCSELTLKSWYHLFTVVSKQQ